MARRVVRGGPLRRSAEEDLDLWASTSDESEELEKSDRKATTGVGEALAAWNSDARKVRPFTLAGEWGAANGLQKRPPGPAAPAFDAGLERLRRPTGHVKPDVRPASAVRPKPAAAAKHRPANRPASAGAADKGGAALRTSLERGIRAVIERVSAAPPAAVPRGPSTGRTNGTSAPTRSPRRTPPPPPAPPDGEREERRLRAAAAALGQQASVLMDSRLRLALRATELRLRREAAREAAAFESRLGAELADKLSSLATERAAKLAWCASARASVEQQVAALQQALGELGAHTAALAAAYTAQEGELHTERRALLLDYRDGAEARLREALAHQLHEMRAAHATAAGDS